MVSDEPVVGLSFEAFAAIAASLAMVALDGRATAEESEAARDGLRALASMSWERLSDDRRDAILTFGGDTAPKVADELRTALAQFPGRRWGAWP